MPVAAAFDKLAHHWDCGHGPASAHARRFHDRIAYLRAVCMRERPQRVLEIGCGTGLNLFALADLLPFGVGIDASPAMIDRAAANAAPRTSQLRFMVGDALALSVGQLGRFDLVLFIGALEHIQPQGAALATARGLLAPEGRILVVMPHPWQLHQVMRGPPRVDGQPIPTRLLSPQQLATVGHDADLAMRALVGLSAGWRRRGSGLPWRDLPLGRRGSLRAAMGEAYAAELSAAQRLRGE